MCARTRARPGVAPPGAAASTRRADSHWARCLPVVSPSPAPARHRRFRLWHWASAAALRQPRSPTAHGCSAGASCCLDSDRADHALTSDRPATSPTMFATAPPAISPDSFRRVEAGRVGTASRYRATSWVDQRCGADVGYREILPHQISFVPLPPVFQGGSERLLQLLGDSLFWGKKRYQFSIVPYSLMQKISGLLAPHKKPSLSILHIGTIWHLLNT